MTLTITPKHAKYVFLGLTAFVIVILIFSFFTTRSADEPDLDGPDVEYRDEETGLERFEDGRVNIDIDTATDNQAPHGSMTITVTSVNATMNRQIMMLGAWRGHEFRHMLFESDINRSADRDVIMKADTTFRPDDDRIEGYLVPKFNYSGEHAGMEYTVYVDQQFMDEVEDPQIRWGFNLEHNKSFEPEEPIDGVYRETVSMDNVERLRADVYAKPHAFVGEWPDRSNETYDDSLQVQNETYFVTY